MSNPADAPLDIREAAAAPPEFQDDGTVKLHLIRPCVGRGKGRHVYSPEMLEANAHKFENWRMFLDHESEGERKARGGLPRSVKDLGGIVLESYWDPNVPAEGRFGKGAVVGKVRPIAAVGELVKLHPAMVESSINAHATGVRPVMAEGAKAWMVEGIHDKGSVDWVTEGGAGGKVAPLLEALSDTPEDQEAALFDSMTDDEVRDLITAERPALMEALVEAAWTKKNASDGDAEDDGPGGDGGADEAKEEDDELQTLVAKHMKKGLPRPLAMKAAKKEMAAKDTQEAVTAPTDPTEGGGVPLTAEDIQEAVLQSLDIRDLINDLVEARIDARLTEETTRVRAEAYADADRMIELRDLKDLAVERIREARLPDAFERQALSEFTITPDGPSSALDVFESYDADGNVVRTAAEALTESVDSMIERQRELVASVRPTRVRGQGPAAPAGDEGTPAPVDRIGPKTRQMLLEAGTDPEKFAEVLALRG